MLIVSDVGSASLKNVDEIGKLISDLDGKVEMMALTSSSGAQFDAFRHANQLAIPFYFTDATVLKTIIRSNPGLTLWVNGTVVAKWHHNDTPKASDVLALIK
jgi:hypothetical protein